MRLKAILVKRVNGICPLCSQENWREDRWVFNDDFTGCLNCYRRLGSPRGLSVLRAANRHNLHLTEEELKEARGVSTDVQLSLEAAKEAAEAAIELAKERKEAAKLARKKRQVEAWLRTPEGRAAAERKAREDAERKACELERELEEQRLAEEAYEEEATEEDLLAEGLSPDEIPELLEKWRLRAERKAAQQTS